MRVNGKGGTAVPNDGPVPASGRSTPLPGALPAKIRGRPKGSRTDPARRARLAARAPAAAPAPVGDAVRLPDDRLDRIALGDCVAGMRGLPDGCADFAFADPPFNIGFEYDTYDDRRAADDYLAWSRTWGAEVVRLLKPDGTFWLAIGDEYAAELKVMFTRELGLTCRSWVVWYYTFGVQCRRKFARSHAHLFHFVRDRERYVFDADAVKVPSARQLVYADPRAAAGGRLPDDTWILRPQDLPEGFAADSDTWYFPRVCGTFRERLGRHPCQMPEQLLGRILRCTSRPGDTVIDPFAGSGTTLAVARKLGRRAVGWELSSEYHAAASERLSAAAPGTPLDGLEDPLTGAPPTERGRRLKVV